MNKKYIDFVPVRQGRVELLSEKPAQKEEQHFVPKKSELTTAKAKKVKASAIKEVVREKKVVEKPVEKSVEKAVEKSEEKKAADEKMKIPKYPFINQEKVKKRPLSKNVYRKEIKTPVEEPKGPITIISKPEKDAHASLIITVILTIILGAAAGTVAFLLLPK
ncbi:hypothetical protein IJJ49_01320 [Candidatus Saccharibacteria bacterium]|nr:hypothetical protein [Candidatus Saccharibacteria bacterium]